MRKIINLNENWQFIQKDVGLPNVLPTDWQTVNLPHTWNAVDGQRIANTIPGNPAPVPKSRTFFFSFKICTASLSSFFLYKTI